MTRIMIGFAVRDACEDGIGSIAGFEPRVVVFFLV